MFFTIMCFSFQINIETLSNKNGIIKTIVETPKYNICDFLRNVKKKDNSILNMITKQFINAVKPPVTSCPVVKGKFLFKNFYLDGSKFPSMTPPGLYFVYFNILTMEDGVHILIIKLGFDIKIDRI